MKFRVGDKVVGEVPDHKVREYVSKQSNALVVNEIIVEAIAKGIRRYIHLRGAREAWMEALGTAPNKRR
jgi:hypothetical protein